MPKLSPAVKGAITAAVMIAICLILFESGREISPGLQYIVYAVYGLGIVWTLLAHRQSAAYTGSFAGNFSQGFRCFVVVVLSMAIFYGVFNYLHPEFAEETSIAYREHLSKQATDKTPEEIDTAVAAYKKQYTLKLVSGAIFGYLIIGAGITAMVSALLTRKK